MIAPSRRPYVVIALYNKENKRVWIGAVTFQDTVETDELFHAVEAGDGKKTLLFFSKLRKNVKGALGL